MTRRARIVPIRRSAWNLDADDDMPPRHRATAIVVAILVGILLVLAVEWIDKFGGR